MFRALTIGTFIAFPLAALLGSAGPASSEESEPRLRKEATSLLRAFWNDPEIIENTAVRRPCEFADRWYDGAIPEKVAKAELGLNLHGDVVGQREDVPALSEMMVRSEADKASFCNSKQIENHDKPLIEKLSGRDFIFIDRLEFSAPVFNAGYSKAAVLRYRSSQGYTPSRKYPHLSDFSAIIFKKRGGNWRRSRFVFLGAS